MKRKWFSVGWTVVLVVFVFVLQFASVGHPNFMHDYSGHVALVFFGLFATTPLILPLQFWRKP